MSCLLCGFQAVETRQENASRTIYNCKKCGMYAVSDLAAEELQQHRHEVLSFVRARKLAGNDDVVLLSVEQGAPDREYVQITVGQIVDGFPRSVADQMDRALENLALLSAYPGDEVTVETLDAAPWFWMRHDGFDALSYIIRSMQSSGLVEVNYYGAAFFPCGLVISPQGWDRLAANARPHDHRNILLVSTRRSSERGQELSRAAHRVAREHAAELSESAVLDPRNLVGGPLTAALRRCDLLVADVGEPGATVHYAVGYARALHKPILLVCHGTDAEAHGFDPADLAVLHWTDKKQLQQSLTGLVGARL